MRVRYSENASGELHRILEYIAQEDPTAAEAVARRIGAVIDRLALFPGTGHSCDIEGVLVAPLVRFPYSIYYAVELGELLILHVQHGARQPPELHEKAAPFHR